ncbi:MAG: hypothetical protein AAFX85_14640 [Pseudomonadota bacterium]
MKNELPDWVSPEDTDCDHLPANTQMRGQVLSNLHEQAVAHSRRLYRLARLTYPEDVHKRTRYKAILSRSKFRFGGKAKDMTELNRLLAVRGAKTQR